MLSADNANIFGCGENFMQILGKITSGKTLFQNFYIDTNSLNLNMVFVTADMGQIACGYNIIIYFSLVLFNI